MDGFESNEGIIVLAATNRVDILDPALLRPGRFDRQITVNYPDSKGREEILKVHARNKPLDSDVDLKVVAKRTPWFTGADLENVLNEAAILSARNNQKTIHMAEILEAINRVLVGPEKKSSVVTEKDKKLVAYHETGHAMVAHLLEHCDPVHEVSIIPRGAAGGYTMTLPGEETRYITKSKLLDDIAMSLGGRAAEDIMLGEISTGALSDLKAASSRARSMVTEYGMSGEIGNIYLGNGHEIFLGRDYGHTKAYSESVSSLVDSEVKKILDEAYNTARKIVIENKGKIKQIVQLLLEHEKIDGEEFVKIVGPRPFSALPEPEKQEKEKTNE
jgi:cell division protease FtsH